MREDLNSLLRRTRIISGSILFFYAATHLLNHSLATFSIAAADAARIYFIAFWRNPVAEILLFASLALHILLGIQSVLGRKSFKMTGREWVQMIFPFVALLAQAAGGGVGLRAAGVIVLAGIAGSQMFNALTALMITKSANAEQARAIMFWLLGNMSGVRWPDVLSALPAAMIGLLACLWHARALDAFTFGSDSAASLGIPVRRVQLLLIGTAALVTAVMVSVVGAIGFVGLVIPHAMRIVVGHRHAILVPASALAGAVFLVFADVISRVIVPGQVLPIGVVTALVGAPVFALILIGKRTSP